MSIFRSLVPGGVLVAEADPRTADPATLHPVELACVSAAVERRRREFTAGRTLARSIMRSFGYDGPLPCKPDGRPDWPPGVVGSIAHCRTLAAVAVGSDAMCAAIGIDVERDEPLPDNVTERIVAAEEWRWVRVHPAGIGAAALRVFCAKEACFKALYPGTPGHLRFDDMIVMPSEDGSGFTTRLRVDMPPFLRDSIVPGRWQARGGHFATAVAIGPGTPR